MLKPAAPTAYSLALALLLVWVLAAPVVAAQAGLGAGTVVRVGIYESRPLVFTDEGGTVAGIYVDLLEYVAAQEGWRLEYVPGTFAEGLERLERGEIDLMTAIAYTQERAEQFALGSETVLANWGQVFARRGFQPQSVLALHGRTVAVISEDVYAQAYRDLATRFGITSPLIEVADYSDALALAQDGDVDAALVSRLYAAEHAARYPNAHETPIVLNPIELRLAAPKSAEGGYLATLDTHLAALKDQPDSAYYQSLRRWLEGVSEEGVPREWFWALGGAGILTLLMVGASLGLRRQVRRRTAELAASNLSLKLQVAERQRAEEETRRRLSELTLLSDVATTIATATDTQEALTRVCGEVAQFLGVPQAGFAILDAQRALAVVVADYCPPGTPSALGVPVPVEGNPSMAYILSRQQPLVAPDVQKDRRLAPMHTVLRQRHVASMLLLPILADGQVLGTLGCDSPVPREFSAAEVALGQQVANHIGQMLRRRQAEESLAASESRYRLLVENAPVGIMSVDGQGRIVGSNPRMLEIVGAPTDADLLGVDLLNGPGITEPGMAADLRECLDGGRPMVRERHYRSVWGRSLWMRYHLTPVSSDGRMSSGLQAVVEDVTEAHRLEDQLRQAHKMEAIGRLAGGIAHDFNNLLTIINGYTDYLLDALPPDADLREDAQAVRRAGQRAADLTRQLLAFSRRQILKPRLIDVSDVIEGMASMLRRLIGEDVRLEMNLAERLPYVLADPGQIEQMVMNLAANARDAMPHGGTLSIHTDATSLPADPGQAPAEAPPGEYVRITLRDDGAGMNAEVMSHLFEPFYTTKETGRGTGLGLSSVYGIVRQSDGYIDVTSAPNEGTTFRIFLPRAASADQDAAEESSSRAIAAMPRGAGERILLVEDEHDVRELAAQYLRGLGYFVTQAESAESAWEMLEHGEGRFDLLITDVVMPGLSGYQLLERLRATETRLPALLLSGYSEEALRLRPGAVNGIPLLQKPFGIAELAASVRGALEGAEAADLPSESAI